MQLGTSGGQAQRAPLVSGVKHTNSGPWAPSAGTGWAQRGPEAAPPRPKDASPGSQLGYLFSPALDAELQAPPGLGGVRPGGGLCPPGSMPGPLRLMRVGAQERDFRVTPEPCTGSSRAEMCRGGGIAVRARPGPPRDPTTQGGLKDTVTGMGCRATCSHVPPTHTWTRRSRAHAPTGGPGWPLRGTGHRGRRAKAGSAGRLTLQGLCSPPRARGMLAAAGVGGKPLPPCLGDSGEQEEQGGAGATPHCPVRPLLHAPGQERRRHLCGAGVGAGPQTGVPLLSVWSAQGLRPACSGHGPAHSSKEWTQEGPWAGPGEVDS